MLRFMIILLNMLAPQNVWAIDFLMNSEGQAAGGLGLVTTTGASSLAYNPAALGNAQKAEGSFETGYLNVKYTYTFPDYDPVEVKVSSPYLNSGLSIPLGRNITIGGSLFPIPGGGPALEVKKIPSRQLSQEPGLIDVKTRNTSKLDYTIASGLAFTNRNWLSVGISYIRSKAETETIVSDSESGSEIFTLETKSISETGLLGLKIKPSQAINLGLTYQSLTKTAVTGAFLNEGGDSFKQVAHKGRQFGAGIKVNYLKVATWIELLHRHHSENSGSVSPFTVKNAATAESFDATSLAMGLAVKIDRRNMLTGAFGWHPTTVGSGFMADDPSSTEEVPGIQFGDMDSISRTLLSAGYRRVMGDWLVKSSVAYQTGNRTVGDRSRAEGQYALRVITMTCSFGTQF